MIARDSQKQSLKTCTYCGLEKKISEFYLSLNRGVKKRESRCSYCKRLARKLYRAKNLQKEKAYGKKYYAEYLRTAKKNDPMLKMKWAKYLKNHRNKNPEKARARWAVSNALRSGRISKELCRKCGSEKSEAHHLDYSKPLLIEWLCHACHRLTHETKTKNKKSLYALHPLSSYQ